MTDLEKSLYVAWIGRFGKRKVIQLTEGYEGAKVGDRIRALIKASTQDQLSALLLEGFAGYFHQTAFLATLKAPAKAVESLAGAKAVPSDTVRIQSLDVNAAGDQGRFLFMVKRKMEFLPFQGNTVISENVPFPVTLSIAGKVLTVQVITMQSGLATWGRIIGQEVRRMLNFVRADFFHERVLEFLVASGGEAPAYHDFSKRSIELMLSDRVDTWTGRYRVADGDTTFRSVHGKGKRALRESRKSDFEKLTSATQIINCGLSFKAQHLSLEAGSKVALYPSTGKIAFRSNLEGCDPDVFIKSMARA